MGKLRIDVNKLENGTADYISLVSRGANRLPFKIIKQHPQHQENGMINLGDKLDLSDIRNVIKGDQSNEDDMTFAPSRGTLVAKRDAPKVPEALPQATLVGIVVEKGEHLTDEVLAGLKAAGIAIDDPIENEDGTVLYPQSDDEVTTVVKMSGSMLALLADADADSIVADTPFAALYDEAGFLPSPDQAMAGLQQVVKRASEDEALSPTERATQISDETAAINLYVQRMTEILPETVIKADALVSESYAHKQVVQKAIADATAVVAAKAEETTDCPMCDGVGCKACDEGKVLKSDMPKYEAILKEFPPKKMKPAAPAAAAPAAAAPAAKPAEAAPAATPAEKPAAPAAVANGGGSDVAPEGVDQDAWTSMTPDEKATVNAAAQGSIAPAAPAEGAAPAAAAAPVAAPAPAGQDPATMPAAAPVNPKKPVAKEEGEVSQVAAPAATISPMDTEVLNTLKAMTATLEGIQKSHGELAETVAKQAADLAEVKGTALKTEKAVKSTIIGAVPGEDHVPGEKVAKGDTALGVIDTAFREVRTHKGSFGERQNQQYQRNPSRR